MNQTELAKKIRELQGRTVQVKDLRGMNGGRQTSREQIIMFALEQNESLNGQDLSTIAKELVNKNDFFIQIGNDKITAREIKEEVIECLQNPINLTPRQEWFNGARSIISEFNSTSLDPSQIATLSNDREDFIKKLDGRQNELQALILLYSDNSLPRSKEIIASLQERLALLEKIETTVKKATKEPEQIIQKPQPTKDEIIKAQMYTVVLNYLEQGKNIPDNLKVKLELTEGVDFSYSIAEQMQSKNPLTDKNNILSRISQLRGRQQAKTVSSLDKSAIRFDRDKYQQMLQERLQQQIR